MTNFFFLFSLYQKTPTKHCGQDQIHFFLFFNPTYCRRSGRRRCQPDQVNSIVLNLPRTSISSHLIFFTFFSIACDFLTKKFSRVFFFFLFNQSTVFIILVGWLMSGLLISTKRENKTSKSHQVKIDFFYSINKQWFNKQFTFCDSDKGF